MTNPSPTFWRGRKVLITGHTGFKGGWLSLWLQRLSAEVTGLSLAPDTRPSLFAEAAVGEGLNSHLVDIRDADAVDRVVRETLPAIVFHMAAQPLVRAGYRDPLATFATNVQGTAHVLEALRHQESVETVVVITTDKVYHNLEHAYPYRESDPLGGHDPYSASKAASEHVVASYRDSWLSGQGVGVASARAGNVIGGGDWSEDRLLPDAVRAWGNGQVLSIRRPEAIRPWQHVLEPLAAYLQLAEQLNHDPGLAGAYNFGPPTDEAATVAEVIRLARQAFGQGEVAWGDGSEGPHEAGWLALEVAKARTQLGIAPRWSLEQAVTRTMHWYKRHLAEEPARQLCMEELAAYEQAAKGEATP